MSRPRTLATCATLLLLLAAPSRAAVSFESVEGKARVNLAGFSHCDNETSTGDDPAGFTVVATSIGVCGDWTATAIVAQGALGAAGYSVAAAGSSHAPESASASSAFSAQSTASSEVVVTTTATVTLRLDLDYLSSVNPDGNASSRVRLIVDPASATTNLLDLSFMGTTSGQEIHDVLLPPGSYSILVSHISSSSGASLGTVSGTAHGSYELEVSLLPACGNGVQETGEQCDDGNTAPGDCCAADCQFEAGPGVPPCCTSGLCQTAQACGAVCFTPGGTCQQPGGAGTTCECALP